MKNRMYFTGIGILSVLTMQVQAQKAIPALVPEMPFNFSSAKVPTMFSTDNFFLLRSATKPASTHSLNTLLVPDSAIHNASRRAIGVGVNLSSNGPGIELAKNLTRNGKLALRFNGSYLSGKINNTDLEVDKKILVLNAGYTLGSASAIFDYHPFGNAFKLSAGVAYMFTALKTTSILKDSVRLGEIMISPKEAGEVKADISLNPFCPYVGIGFGRAVPKRHLGFMLELGSFYIQQPKLAFSTSGMLEPTTTQEKVIQDNISNYSWLPYINFGLNIRLGK